MPDLDVTKALRVLKTHDFQGVPIDFLEKFSKEALRYIEKLRKNCKHDWNYYKRECEFWVGGVSSNKKANRYYMNHRKCKLCFKDEMTPIDGWTD